MPSQLTGAFSSRSNAVLPKYFGWNGSEQVVGQSEGSDLLQLGDFLEDTLKAHPARVRSKFSEGRNLSTCAATVLRYVEQSVQGNSTLTRNLVR